MTAPITIHVEGTPAPQGSKRAFVVNGRAVLTEMSKKVAPWRAAVAAEARRRGVETADGPIRLDIDFRVPAPKTMPKGRWLPDVRPDLDKYLRSTLDGLKSGGVYNDDSQVCEIHACKFYGTPGAVITITRMERP